MHCGDNFCAVEICTVEIISVHAFKHGINIIGNKSREKNELGHRRRKWSCEHVVF